MVLEEALIETFNKVLRKRDTTGFIFLLDMVIQHSGTEKAVAKRLGLKTSDYYAMFRKDSSITWSQVSQILEEVDLKLVIKDDEETLKKLGV